MQKKYQIFVSSTFRDLADERQDTIRSILDLGHIPAGMELFPATDSEQLVYIKKVIDECDYYVLIVGGRYGSLDAEGVSFTEREYDYAVETGKVVLAFVHGDASSIPVGKSDTAARLVENLNAFREKIMSGRLVREWKTREALEAMVVKAISRATIDMPAVGWIRGNVAASEDLLAQINDLRDRNDRLQLELLAISSRNSPKIENLADLSEEILIFYERTTFSHGRSGVETRHLETTWAQIFKGVGPSLIAPAQRIVLASAISDFLKEKTGNVASISKSTIALVENQFVASGLLESYNSTATGGGIYHYLKLSEAGRARLTELLAVKSAKRP